MKRGDEGEHHERYIKEEGWTEAAGRGQKMMSRDERGRMEEGSTGEGGRCNRINHGRFSYRSKKWMSRNFLFHLLQNAL